MTADNFCFVHAADLHLDTPFEGVAKSSPELAGLLRDASLRAFDNLIDLTLDCGAAFLLLAGDIYDGAARGVRAQLRFLRGLERLSAAGVPVFIVHGNHDPLGGWTAVRQWPELVTVFPTGEPLCVPVARHGIQIAAVSGVSYDRPDMSENLVRRFSAPDGPGLKIALLHADAAAKGAEQGTYSPCSPADMERTGFDYWALGHLHLRQVLKEQNPWVVYPGNIQGRSTKPSEQGAKGACVVHVQSGRVSRVEFAACDVLRFLVLEQSIENIGDLAGLRDAVSCAGRALRNEHGGRHLMVRLMLTGAGALHRDLKRPEAVSGLLEDLRDETVQSSPDFWWEDVHDRTKPAIDLAALAGRGDFPAELLAVAERYRSDKELRTELLERCLEPAFKARVFRWVERAAFHDQALELLDQALVAALDAAAEGRD